MLFRLTFDCDNDEFADDYRLAIADVIGRVSDSVAKAGNDQGWIYDVNGNRIGDWQIDQDA